MLSNDTLHIGEEARAKLIAGIKKCALAVGGTMGTGGSNSIIEAIESPGHMVTNDGWTILNSIRLADPIEDMGRKILLEAVSRSNKHSGDGSSTCTVLTASIIEEGLKRITEANPMEIKRSLEDCIGLIEESINKQKREISIDEVGAVAAISAEDEAIGTRIQEIYQQIGKTGIIHWDISKTPEDYYVIGNGITVDGATYLSPYMCDADTSGNNTNQIRIRDANVLICKQKITTAKDFEKIAVHLNGKQIKDLVVFCDEIEPLIVGDLVRTRAVQGFRIVLIKMPVLWKDQWFTDLALASGAKVIDPSAGLSLDKADHEVLGKFGNITVTRTETYIDGLQDLSNHIKELEEEGSDDSKLRASRLNLKTARYFVGGHSDSAISYRRLKVEDAISAAYHALNGGVVAGGGVALLNTTMNGYGGIGWTILNEALRKPFMQIVENTGLSMQEAKNLTVESSIDSRSPHMGYDTRSRTLVDMFEAKITDPAVIVLNAVKNAISVAASILTTQTIVMLPREDEVSQRNSVIGI